MNKYLTTKLAEEGAEVAQAGMKVLLHQDTPARQDFLGEMADMAVMIDIAFAQMTGCERSQFIKHKAARVRREQKKGKAWPKR